MNLLIQTVVILLLLGGCSSISSFNQNDEKLDERHKKILREDFKVEEKVLKKFEPTIEENNQKIEKKIEPKKKVEVLKSTKTEIPKRKIHRPKKIKLKKKTSKKDLIKEVVKDGYPKDYPEKFKKLDNESSLFWNKFKPTLFEGEEVKLHISYMGVSTGDITIRTKKSVSLGGRDAYHVSARVKTADFYSYLYSIDDICDSYIQKDSFLPLKFSLIQRESKQDIDDLQLFDHGELKTYALYKRVTEDKTRKKKKVEFIPKYFQDPFSILYFIRGLPMDKKKYLIPIVNQGKVEMLSAQLETVETIDTELGKKEAFRVGIITNHKGKTIEGGNMTFWFSADDERIFLKFKAKIKIGSISGEIDSYKR